MLLQRGNRGLGFKKASSMPHGVAKDIELIGDVIDRDKVELFETFRPIKELQKAVVVQLNNLPILVGMKADELVRQLFGREHHGDSGVFDQYRFVIGGSFSDGFFAIFDHRRQGDVIPIWNPAVSNARLTTNHESWNEHRCHRHFPPCSDPQPAAVGVTAIETGEANSRVDFSVR